MGSSKKHKEKREKKKHKKARSRSRSRERDSHKRSHKSSQKDRHRSEKREAESSKSHSKKKHDSSRYEKYEDPRYEGRRDSDSYIYDNELAKTSERIKIDPSQESALSIIRGYSPTVSEDDDIDIDVLLESKLTENSDIFSKKHKSSRSSEQDSQIVVGETRKKRKRSYPDSEDSFEKFVAEQFVEQRDVFDKETDQDSFVSVKKEYSPEKRLETVEDTEFRNCGIPFLCEDLEPSRPIVEEKSAPTPKKRKIKEEPEHEVAVIDRQVEERDDLTMGHKGQTQLSLSIAEANKLRAKLGLKPLDVPEEIPGLGDSANNETGAELPKAKDNEVFVKTENIAEVKNAEKLREKISTMKEKRKIVEKLSKVKALGESDSDEEPAAVWVQKSRKLQKEKEEAEKRAKLLEEMDAEFGVGALVEEEFMRKKAYTSKDLKGLTVAHSAEMIKEGQHVILTLKDKGVLDEEEDVLQNVNIVDEEHYAKNVENRKKKPVYRPYDEPEYDEFGILKKTNILSKYDEEIEGAKKKTFTLGSSPYVDKEKELEMIRMKLKQQEAVSLEMQNVRIASEYYTAEDMVKFKKPKKKVRKLRRLKADDLLPDVNESENHIEFESKRSETPQVENEDAYLYGEHSKAKEAETKVKVMDTSNGDNSNITEDLSGLNLEEDQAEHELHSALNKARKLKQKKTLTQPEMILEITKSVEAEPQETKKTGNVGTIVLNSTAEFCRTLGDIPTYGMSGNRDEEADELLDFERELMEERQKQELEAQNRGAWNEVDIDEKPAEIVVRENEPILEEEPDISLGVAGALTLAMKKGYLDKEVKKVVSGPRASQLQAKSYTIEEKFYEDDKFGKRDRYTGPIQDFREKSSYKPDVKLEYIDDSGRLLTAKEAFRYLSHKFHGKGPGKNKVDKRMKKLDQDTRLKQMSSTDTPLNTVKLLQAKQKETQSPYIVLSGGSKTLTQTMISKVKPT